MEKWEEYVSLVGQEFNKKQDVEHRSYKVIGQVALQILNTGGTHALKEFADDVKETYGNGYSFHTYKKYAHIIEVFKDFDIPEDLSVHALNKMSSTSNPQKWMNKVIKEGLTGGQIVKLIEKKEIKRKKKCPYCGQVLVCHACQKEI